MNKDKINNKLNILCKNYNLEYEIYLEKIKTNQKNLNRLDYSLTESNNKLNEIKVNLLDLLLKEVIESTDGVSLNYGINKNEEKTNDKKKSFFKMTF